MPGRDPLSYRTIVTVVGARPQFVKAAVVSRLLNGRNDLREVMVHTGQHYDDNMSGQFFAELGIPEPTHFLGIGGGSHGRMTGRMLEGIEDVLLAEGPAWVLVYGDTNSTLAGALAAAKLHIPVAHVEAGLRSFNRRMPEEVNRVMADHLATVLFPPTDEAVRNLAAEGITGAQVQQVGDLMYDAVLGHRAGTAGQSTVLHRVGVAPGAFVLATVHRAENTDDPARLDAIVNGLLGVARELPVVWPLHPRTAGALDRSGLRVRAESGLTLLPPVGYFDMIELERNARVIATDSGGVQKEAFFLGVPCVTLREETEWVELVALGANRIVAPWSAEVVRAGIAGAAPFPAITGSPYGDGHAGELIVEYIAGH